MIEFVYPKGLRKALTFSYDDGRDCDRRLVDIFNRHGLKGTFHLNSGTLGKSFSNGDMRVEYVREDEVRELYRGHEVACHTVNHLNPVVAPASRVSREIAKDRETLESLTGGMVVGMSYPYGCLTDEVVNIARAQGILYSRTTVSTWDYHLPADFMRWPATCHHGDPRLMELGENYLSYPEFCMSVMYVWGHSFEFGQSDSWKIMEDFADLMAGHDRIWYCTNLELCRYVLAVRAQEFSVDGSMIYNPTGTEIWAVTEDGLATIAPGECRTVG